MKRLLLLLKPPTAWRVPVIILLACFVGLGCYTIYISKAQSYLSDDPAVCVNCHIMAPQYATWMHSSHREQATCNDCHVPHDNVFRKYYFKAKDGLRHATIFTLRAEPQVIQITDPSKKVVQENCNRCHPIAGKDMKYLNVSLAQTQHGEGRLCWECHRETPHGRVNSLSSAPNARVPLPESPVPEWLKSLTRE